MGILSCARKAGDPSCSTAAARHHPDVIRIGEGDVGRTYCWGAKKAGAGLGRSRVNQYRQEQRCKTHDWNAPVNDPVYTAIGCDYLNNSGANWFKEYLQTFHSCPPGVVLNECLISCVVSSLSIP